MAKPFDATLKTLIDDHAADWVGFLCRRLGIEPGPFAILDSDMSTTLQADRLIHLGGPTPALLHMELESTSRLGVPKELLRYNVHAHLSHGVPVYTFLFLLRPRANASDQTGRLEIPGPSTTPYLTFDYRVVRVWREPTSTFLDAGAGLAPLAMLTDEANSDLTGTLERVADRLRTSSLPDKVQTDLALSTFGLCGLRYEGEQIASLIRRFTMLNLEKESVTYEVIMGFGAARELRRTILRQGQRKFGPATPEIEASLTGIENLERLQRMTDRILEAADWTDLLATE